MTEDMASIDGGQGRPPQGGLRTEEGRSWGGKCPRER